MERTKYLSYQEAKEFVSKLRFKNRNEWEEYCKSGNKPDNIPRYPYNTYQNKGWISFGDFLGTGTIANQNKKYLSYEEAKKFVHTLNLKNQTEWEEYCKSGNKPDNIPRTIYTTYKNKGLIDLSDFLGNNKNKKYGFLSYEEAKEFVSKLGLRTQNEWTQYSKSGNKPNNIPSFPRHVYKNKGWISWGDFLNTNFISPQNKKFISYEEAKRIIHPLKLSGQSQWEQYLKSGNKPNNIPNSPYKVYQNKGWISWGDFLGTGIIATYYKKYLSYEEAREFVKKLGFKSQTEWFQYCKSGNKPDNIPFNPQAFYKLKK
jgi:polyhydroxyalkanoate synthesis regulator phasin